MKPAIVFRDSQLRDTLGIIMNTWTGSAAGKRRIVAAWLLAGGFTSEQVADQLGCTKQFVRHVSRLLRNRHEADFVDQCRRLTHGASFRFTEARFEAAYKEMLLEATASGRLVRGRVRILASKLACGPRTVQRAMKRAEFREAQERALSAALRESRARSASPGTAPCQAGP